MPSASASPDRHSVKVTYLEREKPISKAGEQTTTSEDAIETASNATKKRSKKQLGAMQPPESPPMRIDFSRPPPSSASQAGSVRSKASKATHLRSKSSAASLGPRASMDDSVSVSSAKKSKSTAGKPPRTPAKSQPAISDTDMDDATSVAESFSGASRVRRTEAERIEYFKNQPECDKDNITPHLIKCLRCSKDVNLGKKTTYAVRPWEKHRIICDSKVPPTVFGDVKKNVTSSEMTAEERKATLEADTNAVEVKPHEVLCKRCQKWIALHKTQPYALPNWSNHQQSCSGAAPSDRVAKAERILRITNDSDAKWSDAHNVLCKHCGVNVPLEGPGEFNLTSWELHKSNCKRHPPMTTTTSSSSSIGSSADLTLSTPLPQKGTKRAREDSEELEEAREANRPRTDKYLAVDRPSGPFGWFMIPFKAFLSGFQDSLKSEAAT